MIVEGFEARLQRSRSNTHSHNKLWRTEGSASQEKQKCAAQPFDIICMNVASALLKPNKYCVGAQIRIRFVLSHTAIVESTTQYTQYEKPNLISIRILINFSVVTFICIILLQWNSRNVESLNSKQRVYVVAAPIKHDHLNNTAIVASHRLRPLATLYNLNWDSFRADFAENDKKKKIKIIDICKNRW